MTRHLANSASWAALGMALLAGGQAAAQTTTAEVSEVIVTAQRVEENIQTVPIAVTAFSEANLERQSIETLQDIALRTPGGWLLQAGDAYFHHDEMDVEQPSCTPGLRFYQWMMELDRPARLHNQRRLRALRHGGGQVSIFSSHDVAEFERLSGRSARVPAAVRPQ